jgi:hypothetical protein
VVELRDIIGRRFPGETAARLRGKSPRRNIANWVQERLRPVLMTLVGLYVREGHLRSPFVSTGPYHVDRVFRSWR